MSYSHARPAHDFETATGFAGIARSYAMPYGTDQMVESYIKSQANKLEIGPYVREGSQWSLFDALTRLARGKKHRAKLLEFLQPLARDFIELNPELKKVRLDVKSVRELYHFCLGVVSGFNPDDLNFFTEKNRTPSENLQPLFNDVAACYGRHARIEWVCSPETINSIKLQLAQVHTPKTDNPDASLPLKLKI